MIISDSEDMIQKHAHLFFTGATWIALINSCDVTLARHPTMVPSSLWVVLSLTLSFASASPLEESILHRRQSITELTPEQVAAYRPYTYYAGAAGCEPSTTLNWTCGSGQTATSCVNDSIDRSL